MSHRVAGCFLFGAALSIAFAAPQTAFAGDDTCTCDCNGDERVAVAELVTAVAISLERSPLAACAAADADGNDLVAVAELIGGVRAALTGCDGSTPPPTATPVLSQVPPLEREALLAWLEAGSYREWAAEVGIITGGGPHFGRVRTFVNDALFASLTAGAAQHPMGAAAVKELYGGSGNEVRGWTVSVKDAADSAGGGNWYWYERYNGQTYAAGRGVGICTGCHSQNYQTFTSKDLILIPFPLRFPPD